MVIHCVKQRYVTSSWRVRQTCSSDNDTCELYPCRTSISLLEHVCLHPWADVNLWSSLNSHSMVNNPFLMWAIGPAQSIAVKRPINTTPDQSTSFNTNILFPPAIHTPTPPVYTLWLLTLENQQDVKSPRCRCHWTSHSVKWEMHQMHMKTRLVSNIVIKSQ